MAKRLGERLIEAGLISSEAVSKGLSQQRISGHRLGDCLVDLGLIEEAILLRVLAADFKTRYVTRAKLSKAKIGQEILDRIPVRMAETQNVFPVALDEESGILSVVMAEPQDLELQREIAVIADVSDVHPYVGLRRSIQAAIKKYYYGDPTAFLDPATTAAVVLPLDSRGLYSADGGTNGRLRWSETSNRTRVTGSGSSQGNVTQVRDAYSATRGMIAETDFLETLNILVNKIEMNRQDFRGHSTQVARQSMLIARKMGLQPKETTHITIAAQLHEIGKRTDVHYTLPLLAAQSEARAEAKKTARAPLKAFETVHLPGRVNMILAQIYEAYDGSGVPQSAKGEEITTGARIIAGVDAFFDLTRNAFNPFGRVFSKQEALAYLREQAGTLFDPVVVDTLNALQQGELLRYRLENEGRQVFVADPEESMRTDLMDALTKLGLVVQTVVTLDGVVDAVLSGDADAVAVGISFGAADIEALTQFIRARPESAALPILVLGEPTDESTKERLLQSEITGFVTSPTFLDESARTIKAALDDRTTHGGLGHIVSGNFDELPASELLSMLADARKSGRLTVHNGPQEGYLQFESSRVIYATFGEKKGEQAIGPLLVLPQAEFQFDPEAILMDMPNVDRDLKVVARSLTSSMVP
jgi:response regulator RpfG family c-di-GMP phosphodiesterase